MKLSTATPTETDAQRHDGLLGTTFADRIAEAEASERFPRALIEHLGASGVFREEWGPEGCRHPDIAKLNALACRLGNLGSGGIGVGISLHDSAIAILRRFGRSEYLKAVCEQAIDGRALLCVGASEESTGSDLTVTDTEVRSAGAGFEIRGDYEFVVLAPVADHILVVARNVDNYPVGNHGDVLVIAVPVAQAEVQPPYPTAGTTPLDTAAVHIDTWVPADHLVAAPGTGLAAMSWGLAHERISIAGQVASSCQQILGVTLARMMRRPFGSVMHENRALRIRMADLQAQVDLLRFGLDGIAAQGRLDLRAAAAAKATAAKLGGEVLSECMRAFGGAGRSIDQTPLKRWSRDMNLARMVAGTEEVLWEQVAAAMKPDYDGYDALVS